MVRDGGILQLSPSIVDFGQVQVGAFPAPVVITVENVGDGELTILSVDAPIDPFLDSGGSCPDAPFSLAVDAACTLAYQFLPDAPGMASQVIALASSAPSSPALLELTGIAVQPELVVTPQALDFGETTVGIGSELLDVNLSNIGDGPLLVTAINGTSGTPFQQGGGSSTCGAAPFVLPPGASCIRGFFFVPSSPGSQSTEARIISDSVNGARRVSLTGTGLEAAIDVSPTELDFGSVGVGLPPTAPRAITLTNPTDSALLDIATLTQPSGPFRLEATTCGPTLLQPGESCRAEYVFIPQDVGLSQSEVVFESNASSGPVMVPLSGTGLPPALRVSPNPIEFGAVPLNEVVTEELELRNEGAGIATVFWLDELEPPFELDPGTCGGTDFNLESGDACILVIRFQPVQAQSFRQILPIESTDPESPLSIELRGRGQPLAVPALGLHGMLFLLALLLVSATRIRFRYNS